MGGDLRTCATPWPDRISTHIALAFNGMVRNTRWPVAWALWWLLRAAIRHPGCTLASMRRVRRSSAPDRYYIHVRVNGRDVWAWRCHARRSHG